MYSRIMLRTQLSLPESQTRVLDARAAETGLSLSELARRAIDHCYATERDVESDLREIRRAVGGWRDRDEDVAADVERIRPEQ